MIYCDIDAIAMAAAQIDPSDEAQLKALVDLLRVYFDALNNPPDGVIGVGAITYAESALVDYQIKLVDD